MRKILTGTLTFLLLVVVGITASRGIDSVKGSTYHWVNEVDGNELTYKEVGPMLEKNKQKIDYNYVYYISYTVEHTYKPVMPFIYALQTDTVQVSLQNKRK